MRSRNIKPGFFLNDELAELDFASRLLFIGLWCYADRDGYFEWKPKQIRAAIFPYDMLDIDVLLNNLLSCHVITSKNKVGFIPCFVKHQHPHPHEPKSSMKEKFNEINVVACDTIVTACQEDIRIKDVRILGLRKEDSKTLCASSDTRHIDSAPGTDFYLTKRKRKLSGKRLDLFNEFWKEFDYPKGKAEAADAFMDIEFHSEGMPEAIIKGAKIAAQQRFALKEAGRTPKMAQGWLSSRRWEDEECREVVTSVPQILSERDRILQKNAESCRIFAGGDQ